MKPPVAILAVGNRSRGDDAAGPLLLDRLRERLAATPRARDFELIEAFQLQVENALDLEGRSLALFIDARRGGEAPALLAPVAPAARLPALTHALEPAALLAVYRQVVGGEPPPAWSLGVRAEDFELGAEPGAATRRALEEAWAVLAALCERPGVAAWAALAAGQPERDGARYSG